MLQDTQLKHCLIFFLNDSDGCLVFCEPQIFLNKALSHCILSILSLICNHTFNPVLVKGREETKPYERPLSLRIREGPNFRRHLVQNFMMDDL